MSINRRIFISTATVASFAAPALAKPESEIIRLYREYVELEAIDTGTLSEDAVAEWCKRSSGVQQRILESDVHDGVDFAAKVDALVHPDFDLSSHEIQRLKADAIMLLNRLT